MFRVFGVTASRMVGKQVKSEEYMPKEEKVRGEEGPRREGKTCHGSHGRGKHRTETSKICQA